MLNVPFPDVAFVTIWSRVTFEMPEEKDNVTSAMSVDDVDVT
jgi:hypothetical protein